MSAGANRHWPKFDLLVDRAQHRHVQVMLDVTDELIVSDVGKEQRGLRRIRLVAGDKVIAHEPIVDGDLDRAALLTLRALA